MECHLNIRYVLTLTATNSISIRMRIFLQYNNDVEHLFIFQHFVNNLLVVGNLCVCGYVRKKYRKQEEQNRK